MSQTYNNRVIRIPDTFTSLYGGDKVITLPTEDRILVAHDSQSQMPISPEFNSYTDTTVAIVQSNTDPTHSEANKVIQLGESSVKQSSSEANKVIALKNSETKLSANDAKKVEVLKNSETKLSANDAKRVVLIGESANNLTHQNPDKFIEIKPSDHEITYSDTVHVIPVTNKQVIPATLLRKDPMSLPNIESKLSYTDQIIGLPPHIDGDDK